MHKDLKICIKLILYFALPIVCGFLINGTALAICYYPSTGSGTGLTTVQTTWNPNGCPVRYQPSASCSQSCCWPSTLPPDLPGYGCFQTIQTGVHNWSNIHTNTFYAPFNYYTLFEQTLQSGITTSVYNDPYGDANPCGAVNYGNSWTNSMFAAAVDAHVFAGVTYNYLKSVLGFTYYDSHLMATNVGEPETMDEGDGYFNLDSGTVNFGVLSALSATSNNNCDPNITRLPMPASLDTVAHEWGHGVSRQSIVRGPGQEVNGPMDEAFSDWVGISVKHNYKGSSWNDNVDWLFGADAATQHSAGRDLKNPPNPYVRNPSPDYYPGSMPPNSYSSQNLWCEPYEFCTHEDTGPANKMFYLLSVGGTNSVSNISVSGIGIDNAMKVAYAAENSKWNPQNTYKILSFEEAEEGMIAAAYDIDNANSPMTNYNVKVRLAWTAVGVGNRINIYTAGTGSGSIMATSGYMTNNVQQHFSTYPDSIYGKFASTAVYPPGDYVTLLATPNPGSTFTGWSAVCPSFSDLNCTCSGTLFCFIGMPFSDILSPSQVINVIATFN